jgi:hypothetical protein
VRLPPCYRCKSSPCTCRGVVKWLLGPPEYWLIVLNAVTCAFATGLFCTEACSHERWVRNAERAYGNYGWANWESDAGPMGPYRFSRNVDDGRWCAAFYRTLSGITAAIGIIFTWGGFWNRQGVPGWAVLMGGQRVWAKRKEPRFDGR